MIRRTNSWPLSFPQKPTSPPSSLHGWRLKRLPLGGDIHHHRHRRLSTDRLRDLARLVDDLDDGGRIAPPRVAAPLTWLKLLRNHGHDRLSLWLDQQYLTFHHCRFQALRRRHDISDRRRHGNKHYPAGYLRADNCWKPGGAALFFCVLLTL
jgi:hypothetical protein